MEDLKDKGLKIYNAIFQGEKSVELDEIDYPIRKFSSGIRYVDLFFTFLQLQNSYLQLKIIWSPLFTGSDFGVLLIDVILYHLNALNGNCIPLLG